VAQQFAQRLEELAGRDSDDVLRLSDVAVRAREFERRVGRLDACAGAWRSRYRDSDRDAERAAAVLNGCMKQLSNRLIPIQSTVKGVYGHDPYGYTPQLTAIPCLYETEEMLALPDGVEARIMLETHLRRQRNRVADAIAEASAAVDDALAQLGE
jgi:hypothetical protein